MEEQILSELKEELQGLSVELMYVSRLIEAATKEVKRLIDKQEEYERLLKRDH